ncbi:unnamed protein product [Cunninghamella blakesleeana]
MSKSVYSLVRSFSTSVAALAKKNKKAKEVSDAAPVLLGRPSNHLKMGVVGLPNIGKSSLFNALTNSSVPAENYPFCTIVPDKRFDWLCELYQPNKITPAHLTVLDIAGLVRGASKGAGLGNAFLANVASVDGLYHLVRAFENDDITHVENTVDPIRDLTIIQDELRLKDEESIERILAEKSRIAIKSNDPTLKQQLKVIEQVAKYLSDGRYDIRKGQWDPQQINVINTLHLLTAKPMVYLCNISMDDYLQQNENKWLKEIKSWMNENNNADDIIIPFSVAFESMLIDMTDDERADFLKSNNNATSQLPNIILSGYKALDLIHYFTCGPEEVRAWSVRKYSKAPQAAGVIHTDFERGFISAEIMKYADLESLGSEANVRTAGKLLQKGKDYVMEDGDIAYFKFNVTGNKKK